MATSVKVLRLIFILTAAVLLMPAGSEELNIKGQVETVRTGGYVTLLLESEPDPAEYLFIHENIIIGKVFNFKPLGYSGSKIRYLASFSLTDERSGSLMKAGLIITMKQAAKIYDRRTDKTVFQEKHVYKPVIISQVDNREMVLIPRGKFQMGSNSGDEDEYPEHSVNLTEYYIDRYEVSNEDYRIYAESRSIPYPEYWKGKISRETGFNDPYFKNLPVTVSYHEAADYAKWCWKRLPDEMEWEKAARRPPSSDDRTWSIYTWGNSFRDGISNTEEFWSTEEVGLNLKTAVKEKYGLTTLKAGPLPVDMYDTGSVSIYGVIHMDGNVSEWTDSWYRGYEGTRTSSKLYGTQYKVIRGGSYSLGKNESRVTDRKIGGIPDLYKDRISGFRCVKDVTVKDRAVSE